MMADERAAIIVYSIWRDLTGRRGLRHEWDAIDDETKAEILNGWIDKAKYVLENAVVPLVDMPLADHFDEERGVRG